MVSDLGSVVPVVYMGGACGDLVTSMIDATGAEFDTVDRRMLLPQDRMRLKRPQDFSNDEQKDHYLETVKTVYTSVPSHDVDYHVRRGHAFVAITVQDWNTAVWAAKRFRDVHNQEVWQRICRGWNIETVDHYAQLIIDNSKMLQEKTNYVVKLEHIRSGEAVPVLEHIIGRKLHRDSVYCYDKWQEIQNATS